MISQKEHNVVLPKAKYGVLYQTLMKNGLLKECSIWNLKCKPVDSFFFLSKSLEYHNLTRLLQKLHRKFLTQNVYLRNSLMIGSLTSGGRSAHRDGKGRKRFPRHFGVGHVGIGHLEDPQAQGYDET